jgi:SAM-dependent methyltransferase
MPQQQHQDFSNTPLEGPEDAPFEWLTSPASLDPIFKRIFSPKNDPSSSSSPRQQRVLHVGCGTSRLGEHLVDRWNVASVVNVDVDRDVLRRMQARWEDPHRQEGPLLVSRAARGDSAVPAPPRMLFEVVDYSHEVIVAGGVDDKSHSSETSFSPQAAAAVHGPFDLIVDKSTLDCLLCTESAAAHLLQHVYNSLSSQGGVYLLISFQHVDLLRPLLEGLTDSVVVGEEAADAWQVQSLVMKRQVEDLRRRDRGAVTDHEGSNTPDNDLPSHMDLTADAVQQHEPSSATTQWSSGSFHPDAKYHQFVNVFICRKHRRDDDYYYLSREHVVEHVKTVCNQWWTEQNPILSPERMAHLRSVFGHSASTTSSSSSALSLPEAYEALFTEAEREHLEYEHFLEDWHGFLSTRSALDQTTMTLATALAFLNEVQ